MKEDNVFTIYCGPKLIYSEDLSLKCRLKYFTGWLFPLIMFLHVHVATLYLSRFWCFAGFNSCTCLSSYCWCLRDSFVCQHAKVIRNLNSIVVICFYLSPFLYSLIFLANRPNLLTLHMFKCEGWRTCMKPQSEHRQRDSTELLKRKLENQSLERRHTEDLFLSVPLDSVFWLHSPSDGPWVNSIRSTVFDSVGLKLLCKETHDGEQSQTDKWWDVPEFVLCAHAALPMGVVQSDCSHWKLKVTLI